MAFATYFKGLMGALEPVQAVRPVGRVVRVHGGVVAVKGLEGRARIGDRLKFMRSGDDVLWAEVVQLEKDQVIALPEGPLDGIHLGARATLFDPITLAPEDYWIGRVISPDGIPLDGRPLLPGAQPRPLQSAPPAPAERRAMGARLNTGMTVTNTFLPLVRGQRMGLFAGSGVGKSSLLGHLARHMEADVIVIALIGERGRELRHFLEEVLGSEGLRRAIVVAATSDQSPLQRRRCAWSAMTVAEHFRDAGKSVLLVADSVTRFAEAHREVAVAAGEAPVLRGYPPSTAHLIMSLCERAGPGTMGQGDITALFSVLVAGSDMEEPIADILRGVLDGHMVLDREIAERGRYPAIDVLRSVSRSLPAAATDAENALIAEARRLLSVYDNNAMMIRAGLYTQGTDKEVDQAIANWAELDGFLAKTETQDCSHSFKQLDLLLRRGRATKS